MPEREHLERVAARELVGQRAQPIAHRLKHAQPAELAKLRRQRLEAAVRNDQARQPAQHPQLGRQPRERARLCAHAEGVEGDAPPDGRVELGAVARDRELAALGVNGGLHLGPHRLGSRLKRRLDVLALLEPRLVDGGLALGLLVRVELRHPPFFGLGLVIGGARLIVARHRVRRRRRPLLEQRGQPAVKHRDERRAAALGGVVTRREPLVALGSP
mmetsp:Transcript_19877/g.61835  ORF Transcript_19877/g.61835 Transcript_19877/m.61835 type:complete len:216 (-) Transcript_19877:274-921(-)